MSQKKIELQMRNQGYKDGLANRAARHVDAYYQQAWRRGQEKRAEIKAGKEV